MLFSGDVVY